MKSLGDTLRDAREARGISMEQAVHETNISRNYLEALENEAFEEFPAEAYLVGFLRNYGDFLGLDQEKIVGQFRNYKLSEEPAPMEQLVGPPKGARLRKALPWVVLGLAVVAAGIFGIPRLVSTARSLRQTRQEKKMEDKTALPVTEIRPEQPSWEGEVRPGNILILEAPGEEARFEVAVLDNRLKFVGKEGRAFSIIMGEEVFVPGEKGEPLWRVYLKDFGLPGGGGMLEVQTMARSLPEEAAAEEALPLAEPPSGEPGRRKDSWTIISSATPERYTLEASFSDYALLRYQLDNQDAREAYYSAGDKLRLDVGRMLTLWVSDAGAFSVKISGKDFSPGGSGQVAVYQVRWVLNDETGMYDLTALPLY